MNVSFIVFIYLYLKSYTQYYANTYKRQKRKNGKKKQNIRYNLREGFPTYLTCYDVGLLPPIMLEQYFLTKCPFILVAHSIKRERMTNYNH